MIAHSQNQTLRNDRRVLHFLSYMRYLPRFVLSALLRGVPVQIFAIFYVISRQESMNQYDGLQEPVLRMHLWCFLLCFVDLGAKWSKDE